MTDGENEDLNAVNETDEPIIGKDPTGRPIYIQRPGQTLYEAYQDAVYGPCWRVARTAASLTVKSRAIPIVDAAYVFREFMRKSSAYFATRKDGVSLTLIVDMYNSFCHAKDAPERVLDRDGVINFAMNYWDHSESRTYGDFVDYLFFGFRREQVS